MNLPAAPRRSSQRDADTPAQKYRFIVPAATWERSAVHSALSIISPPLERQIDPRIDPALLRLLADGHTDGFCDQFITFDEDDAFSRATGEGNQYFDAPCDQEQAFAQPFIARAYLDAIYQALSQDECDEDTEDTLLASLRLPDVNGKAQPFAALHTSAPLPADVPGLRLPPILHADLATHPLFRRRKWRRPKYTMARFIESGVLRNADEQTRLLFWNWLRKNERRIAPRERPKLADLPIWPDQSGDLCILSGLCDPRSRRVAAALASSIRRPHEQVRRSKLVSSGAKSRTSIRRLPTGDEIGHWLDQQTAAFFVGETANVSTIAALHRFEADLAILLKDAGIARLLKAADVTVPALAQDGSIRQRTALVMPARGIDRLALRARFLLKDRQHAATLDKLSPSLSTPTPVMLLETLAEDATNFGALQPRLQQFLTITHDGDDDRRQLADMAIIPVHGAPRAPATLAFTGPRGDYWGAWKTRISGKGLSQDDTRRYRAAGVTSALPDRETSRAFFEWLSGQSEDVLQHHIHCVLRHILHRDGPAHWAATFTDIPFIPSRCRDGVRLVSLRSAQRRPVYLPDAEDVAEAIIQHDPAVLLVIEHVREVTEPVTEPLRDLGIRSLREALKEPESASGAGETAPAGGEVVERLRALRSSHFRRTFLKRLATLGVETDLVWRDWHERLSRIRAIHFADKVEACYRFRGRLYTVPAEGGFDPTSGTFWMKNSRDVGLSSLYESIAAQLVFKPSARPVDCLALERALDLEIRDPSYGRPHSAAPGAEDEDDSADTEDLDAHAESGDEGDGGDPDPGEAVFGHSPFKPDPSRNTPHPGPISSSPTAASRRSGRSGGGSGGAGGNSGTTPAPELELEHIEALKRGHYASHCQMCLCERTPQVLAPPGSYIQWEEVRRRVVEAHHVDLKSAGGARHAGNLILLCKFHHDNYGRRLTRAAITEALKGDILQKVVRFGAGGEAVTAVEGRQIEMTISDTGEVVEVFFTTQHADYWLSQAKPLADAPDISKPAASSAADKRGSAP